MSTTALRTPASSSPFVRSDKDHKAETGGLLEVHGSYRVRLAASEADRLAAFRLRFLVFNLELSEGLDTAHATGYDTDEFDAICDHLIVEHPGSGKVVGTYRLQTGAVAVQARLLGRTGSRLARWLQRMLVTTANVNSTSHPTSGWGTP